MKVSPLFKKYRKQIISFANTTWGRSFFGIKGNNYIFQLSPSSYREVLGVENDKYVLQTTVFTRNVFLEKLRIALQSMQIVEEHFSKFRFNSLLNYDNSFVLPNYLGIYKASFLPQIMMTTGTFNPDASPESTSVDGECGRNATNETWATIVSSAGNSANDSATINNWYCVAGSTSSRFNTLRRYITLFDTSSIDDAESVDSATYSPYVKSKPSNALSMSVNVVSCNPASNTSVASSDYNIARWGSTKFSSDVTVASVVSSGYQDFTLNTDGLANITTSGVSKFGVRFTQDIDNSAPSWSSGGVTQVEQYMADQGGGTIPKLVVISTIPVSSGANAIFFSSGGLGVA